METVAALSSGCVIHTKIQDTARAAVQFSSPTAAQTFYDAYLSAADPQGVGSVTLYVPTPYWRRTVSTDNVRFNAAAAKADSNHDQIISEDEAQQFAATTGRKVATSAH
jgi:hypothetical protein